MNNNINNINFNIDFFKDSSLYYNRNYIENNLDIIISDLDSIINKMIEEKKYYRNVRLLLNILDNITKNKYDYYHKYRETRYMLDDQNFNDSKLNVIKYILDSNTENMKLLNINDILYFYENSKNTSQETLFSYRLSIFIKYGVISIYDVKYFKDDLNLLLYILYNHYYCIRLDDNICGYNISSNLKIHKNTIKEDYIVLFKSIFEDKNFINNIINDNNNYKNFIIEILNYDKKFKLRIKNILLEDIKIDTKSINKDFIDLLDKIDFIEKIANSSNYNTNKIYFCDIPKDFNNDEYGINNFINFLNICLKSYIFNINYINKMEIFFYYFTDKYNKSRFSKNDTIYFIKLFLDLLYENNKTNFNLDFIIKNFKEYLDFNLYELMFKINFDIIFTFIYSKLISEDKIVYLINNIDNKNNFRKIYRQLDSYFQDKIGHSRILYDDIKNINIIRNPTQEDYDLVLFELDNL